MRQLIYNLAISLDGFIEGPEGEFDWCFTDHDYGMTQFLADTNTILFGRKSYELMLKFDPKAYPEHTRVVVSNSLKSLEPGWELWQGELQEKVRSLKQQPGKNIWLFGGASLAGQLLEAGQIDELQLSVHPVLLGQGKPLFENQTTRTHLELISTKSYESGLVQLVYRVKDTP